ncbi:hypothetical protein GCM10010218_12140 [Streptomyces mashuensis]|uniref:Uncharacterized protein n=1 Tax=Streptomyces mashuensis TaxID=33904 RepID=A0A919AYH6_9ACTN|nr:hypothetical protein GCM10010218_12140 [Streptomyces mashuensis]
MKDEFSASVCCAWEAVRMSTENGVGWAAGAAGESKAGLRWPGGGTGGRDGRAGCVPPILPT